MLVGKWEEGELGVHFEGCFGPFGEGVCWFERWVGLCEEILGNVRCLMCLMWGLRCGCVNRLGRGRSRYVSVSLF